MKRLLSILLTFTFVIGLLLTVPPSISAASEPVIVVAGSDFQHASGHSAGKEYLDRFISAMQEDGITDINGFLFAGDYDYDTFENSAETTNGLNSVKESVSVLDPEHSVYVQGNHDAAIGTCGMSKSGANDHPDGLYGVFVINEDDFTWNGQIESSVKQTAQNLINYLNIKLNAGYDKPIFVVSHLPIHYNYRTRNNGDGIYGNYIFNALNEAAEKGLNIIFMFGHNHSSGWDDFLGGSSVFLKKGDTLNIPQGSKYSFTKETLNFTYMNAGYVSYYVNNGTADTTLTMSVFEIKDDSVDIKRYRTDGLYHYLKAQGSTNFFDESHYSANKDVYPSPYTLELSTVNDRTPIEDIVKNSKPKYGRNYKKVVSLDELEDGGQYLLVHNQYGDKLMIPSVVTKSNSSGSRTGFDFKTDILFSDQIVTGNYNENEWTLVKSDGTWLLKSGDKYAAFTKKSDHVSVTLENVGTSFEISGSADNFRFTADINGDTVGFNYNSREVINGYKDGAESFAIYKLIGYAIDVRSGYAMVDGNVVDVALPGQVVTLVADDAPEDKAFDKWVVTRGKVTVSDDGIFTMPEAGVIVRANYVDSNADKKTNVKLNEKVVPIVVIIISATSIISLIIIRRSRKNYSK